jgi:histone deacetylase HOS3
VPPIPSTAPGPNRTTSRPSSRAGNRTQSSNRIPVKKAQAAAPRTEPAQKVSRGTRGTNTPARATKQPAIGDDTPTPATGLPLNDAGRDTKDDVDKLTNGVRKIKINLITKSKRDAKQQSKPGPNKTLGHQVGRNANIVKSEKPPTPEGMSSIIPKRIQEPLEQLVPAADQPQAPPTPSLSGGVSTPVEECYASSTSSPTPVPSIPAGSSPDVPYVTIQPASDAGDVFIPYQPEGPEPVAMGQQEALKWLPPNISTPSATPAATTPATAPATIPGPGAVEQQNNLFHYTSGIPFAPKPDTETQQCSGPLATSHSGGEISGRVESYIQPTS